MYTCAEMLVLGLANVPLVAGVHQLAAGLLMLCKYKYLLSVILTLRHDASSLLKAALANLTLASFCLAVA